MVDRRVRLWLGVLVLLFLVTYRLRDYEYLVFICIIEVLLFISVAQAIHA
jgi:hypothetical protein